jgi:redox-sensitive bicupin YhaK (pirin superfamily)
MLDGHMLHEDHLGNRGDLQPGSVQWMTAGRGVIHSEMPQQTAGRMRGFQLWINLPASEKMKPASYRDIAPSEIPSIELAQGGRVKIIAGAINIDGDIDGKRHVGPIHGLSTDPTYIDVSLPAGASFEQSIDSGYTVFVYPYEGSLLVGGKNLATQTAGVLSGGDRVSVSAAAEAARFILLAGKPLGEPIVQYGPFVMNTRQEIEQAVRDYQSGALTR